MSNRELKQFYSQFIAMIGNQPDGKGEGIGLYGFLNDVADRLRGIAATKEKAWRDSDFSLPDNGSKWLADAEKLEIITGIMRPKVKIFAELASLVAAWHNCQDSGKIFASSHETTIKRIMRETAPHGSGFDNGTHLDLEESTKEKLVFRFDFHHMNDGGYYCGYTSQTLTVTPSFIGGFDMDLHIDDSPDDEDYNEESFSDDVCQRLEIWLSSEINPADFVEQS